MNDIKSFVLQQFKDAFPNFNWRIGSMIRELLVEPLAYLTEILDHYSNYLNNLNNITYVLDNPDECANEIDTWMRQLNIVQPQQSASTGTVAILVNSPSDFTIPRGTVFVWGSNVNIFVENQQTFTLTDGTMKQLCYSCYKIVVDVATIQNTSISLSCGAPLVWAEAPNTVTDIYVESPITGGVGELSYTARADMIRSVLTTPAPCGEANILAGLQRRFPETVADVKTHQVAGTAGSGEVPITLKQRAVPTLRNFTAIVTANNSGELMVAVPRQRLLYIKSVAKLSGESLPYTISDSSDTGDTIALKLATEDGLVVVEGETVTVTTLAVTESAKCFDWLNSAQVGSPYRFVEVVPAIAIIELEINAQGRKNITETELLEIQEYINHSKINQTITDGGISQILQAQRRTLSRAVTYRGTVYYRGEAKSFCSSSGMLNLTALGVFPGVPTMAYTTVDKIRIV